MKIAFILTMPNVASWNGKWTGDGTPYMRVRELSKPAAEKVLSSPDYGYSWPDGWGANVEVRRVTARETQKILRVSRGFCGYDWMIDSIIDRGYIVSSSDLKREAADERD